jgi:general secretion pathway protein D
LIENRFLRLWDERPRGTALRSLVLVALLATTVAACATRPQSGSQPSSETQETRQNQTQAGQTQANATAQNQSEVVSGILTSLRNGSGAAPTASAGAPQSLIERDGLEGLDQLSDNRAFGLRGPEIFRGTGIMTNPVRVDTSRVSSEGGAVTLNFVDAEVREVVDVILGEMLGVSYLIDPQVQGKVTARTTEPIERKALIPALENILALNGSALVRVNGLYKVLPVEDATSSISAPLLSSRDRYKSQGYGLHIIPLRYASAIEVLDIVQSFVGPGRVLRADTRRNLLLFAGNGSEAADLAEMVGVFDVDWMRGMSFGLFPMEVANASELVKELEIVFFTGSAAGLDGVVRFIPIERLNAVLVISPQPRYLDQAQNWIERLDRGTEGSGRRIFVYHVQNKRASDLANVLGQIFTGESVGGRTLPRASVAPGLRPSVVGAARAQRQQSDGAEGAEEGAPRQNIRSVESTIAQAVDVAADTGEIRIIADETTNALVVLATLSEYRMIEATLRRLDVVPLQVLIEVTIAEVSLQDELQYGLQWFFSEGNSSAALSNFESGIPTSSFPGFSYVFASNSARVVLNALTEVTDVNIISSPQLMVLDNQTARLQVGDQVPVATKSSVPVDTINNADFNSVNEIELRDTGVILEVTPRVNASGLVTMDVLQEVSDVVSTTTSEIDSPTIQQRQIQSTVAVQSGQTIALGGLIVDDAQDGYSGVPVLSSIPIFGNLFKTTTESKLRQELLVLITPRVVRDQGEAQDVTEELRRRLSGFDDLEKVLRYKTAE